MVAVLPEIITNPLSRFLRFGQSKKILPSLNYSDLDPQQANQQTGKYFISLNK